MFKTILSNFHLEKYLDIKEESIIHFPEHSSIGNGGRGLRQHYQYIPVYGTDFILCIQ